MDNNNIIPFIPPRNTPAGYLTHLSNKLTEDRFSWETGEDEWLGLLFDKELLSSTMNQSPEEGRILSALSTCFSQGGDTLNGWLKALRWKRQLHWLSLHLSEASGVVGGRACLLYAAQFRLGEGFSIKANTFLNPNGEWEVNAPEALRKSRAEGPRLSRVVWQPMDDMKDVRHGIYLEPDLITQALQAFYLDAYSATGGVGVSTHDDDTTTFTFEEQLSPTTIRQWVMSLNTRVYQPRFVPNVANLQAKPI